MTNNLRKPKQQKWNLSQLFNFLSFPKKYIYATNLLSLFYIKHPAAAQATKGGQLSAVSKPEANNGIRAQAHHQTSQELFFIVSLTLFGKRKVFLFSFFLPFFFFWLNFFNNLDLKKTIIKKCLKQIIG